EARDEFDRLAQGLEEAHRKWATGIYLAWYPRKDPQGAEAFANRLKRDGLAKMLRVEVDLGGDPARLAGPGLLILNPPWRLEQELAILLPELADMLAQGERPHVRIDWLTSER